LPLTQPPKKWHRLANSAGTICGTEIKLAEQTTLTDGCEMSFQFQDGWVEHFDSP
jgi:hypothetical protein